jgi:hypothetical protein
MPDLFGRPGVKPHLCLKNVETALVTIVAGRCDFHYLGSLYLFRTFTLLSQQTDLSH